MRLDINFIMSSLVFTLINPELCMEMNVQLSCVVYVIRSPLVYLHEIKSMNLRKKTLHQWKWYRDVFFINRGIKWRKWTDALIYLLWGKFTQWYQGDSCIHLLVLLRAAGQDIGPSQGAHMGNLEFIVGNYFFKRLKRSMDKQVY